MAAPYFTSLAMAGVLALSVRPLYEWLRRFKWRPAAAAAAVTLGVMVLLLGPAGAVAARAVKEGTGFVRRCRKEGEPSFRRAVHRASRGRWR